MADLNSILSAINSAQATPPEALDPGAKSVLDAMNAGAAPEAPKPKKSSTTPWGVLGRVLNDTVGVPLHASEALAVNAGRGVGELFGQDYGKNNPSLSNVWNQIVKPEDQFHGTDFITGNDAKGLTKGLYGGSSGGGIISDRKPGKLSTIAMGLFLDASADPLNAISPASEVHGADEVARLVAEEGAKHVATAAGRDLGQEGLSQLMSGKLPDLSALDPSRASAVKSAWDAASTAVKKARAGGVSNLSPEEIEKYGAGRLQRGLEIKLPGGRAVPVTPKFDTPLSALSVARNEAKGKVTDFLFGKNAPNALAQMGAAPDLMFGARHGDMAATLQKGTRATYLAQARALDAELGGHLHDAIKDASNEDLRQAWDAIDNQLTPKDPKIAELASDLSEVHAHIAHKLVEGGLLPEEKLMSVGTYVPHPVANEAQDIMQHAGLWPAREDLPPGARGFMENKRTFFDPSNGHFSVGLDSEDHGTDMFTGVANSRAQAEEKVGEEVARRLAAKEAAGDEATVQYLAENPHIAEQVKAGNVPIFKEPRAALEHMVRSVSRRLAQARAGQQTFVQGIMGEHGGSILDPRFMRGGLRDATQGAAEAMSPEGLAAQKAAAEAQQGVADTQRQVAYIAGSAGAEPPPEAPPSGGVPTTPEPTPPAPAAPAVDLEAERAATAARGEAIKGALPAPAEGYQRLYNGGGTSWFTPEITRAMGHMGVTGEDLRYLDVKPEAYARMQAESAGATLGEQATTAGDVVLNQGNPHLMLAQDIPREVIRGEAAANQQSLDQMANDAIAALEARNSGNADTISQDLTAKAPGSPSKTSPPSQVVESKLAAPSTVLPEDHPLRVVLRRASEIDASVDRARDALVPVGIGDEGSAVESATAMRQAAQDLHIVGANRMSAPQLRDALAESVRQHDADAAVHAAQVEGRAAEEAHNAAHSVALADYTTGEVKIKRGESFWKARQEAIGDAADANAQIADANAQLAEVRKTIAAVEQTGGVREIGPTDRVAKQLESLTKQREDLARALEVKKRMDLQDVLKREQTIAAESGLPDMAEHTSPSALEAAVGRLGGEGATPEDLTAAGKSITPTGGQTLSEKINPEDAAVTAQIEDQLAHLDQRIERLQSSSQVTGRIKPMNEVDAALAQHHWAARGTLPETATRVVVTGGRDAVHPDEARAIIDALKAKYGDNLVIVHGAARGADTTFAKAAEDAGLATEAHPADWKGLGRSAGFQRNTEMATGGATRAADHTMPMNFAYGNDARPGITASTTFDAIANGERTSTTRFGQYARTLETIKPGQIVEFTSKDGRKLRVVVDSVRRIDPATEDLARLSQTEGWSQQYLRNALDTKGQSGAAVMEYHLESAGAGRPDLAVAFPGGNGTAHMVGEVGKEGIPILRVGPETPADLANRSGGITNLDLYKGREEALQAKVAEHTAALNDAQRRLVEAQQLGKARTVAKTTVTPGSALDEAYSRLEAASTKVSESTFLGDVSDKERTAFSTRPIEGWDNGEPVTLKEGTTAAEARALKPEVAQAHADIIRNQWKALAETAGAHDHMAEAFRTYQDAIDKAIPASPKRDLVALTDSQIDHVGMAGNNPEGATQTANDLLGQTKAELRMPNEVIRGPVKESAKVASVEVRNMLDLLKQASASNDTALGEVANLRIIAANLGHQADLNARGAQETLDAWDRAMADPVIQGKIKTLLQRGTIDYSKYRMLSPGILTPRDVADQLLAFDRYNPDPNKFFDGVRKMIKYMRTWQIVTPGFHMRVTFGGMFNNALFGVQAQDYERAINLWGKWARGVELTGKDAADFEKLSSVLHPGQEGSQAILHDPSLNAGAARFNPVSVHGPIVKFNYKLGAGSQYMTRAAMGMKVIREGGSVDEIVNALDKYHFNYGDLGRAEQKIKQNVAPFFTWTRHNLPLQVQQLVDNPKLYSRFLAAKQDIESQSTPANGEVIPGFAANSLLIRLPFMSGGGHTFITPDLPLRSLTDIAAPLDAFTSGKGDFADRFMQGFSGPLGQLTPVVAGPIETYFGKQIFHGIPLADNKGTSLKSLHIPSWLHYPLDLAGVTAVDKASGEAYITNRNLYLVNKLLPIFARQQALSGSGNQKTKDNQMAKLISFFLGTTVTTNTLKQQSATNYVNSLETKRRTSIHNSLTAP